MLMIAGTQLMVYLFLIKEPHWPFDYHVLILSLSTSLVAAAGYVINDITDREIDIINKPGRVVLGRWISEAQAYRLYQCLVGSSMLLSLLVGWKIFMLHGIYTVLLYFYSKSWKGIPFLGNAVVSLITAMAILEVAIYFGQNNPMVWLYFIIALFANLVREVLKDLEDQAGDRRAGLQTLPVLMDEGIVKLVIHCFLFTFALTTLSLAYAGFNLLAGTYYSILGIGIFSLSYLLEKASGQARYRQISQWVKYLMIAGIAGMALMP